MEMMSGSKLDVIWSPVHHDKFILWGSDITLYQVSRLKDIEKKTTYTQISPNRGATVIASQSANGVRCVDISAIPEQPEPLLALGHSNGRVSLASLKQAYDPLGLVGREFNPRHSRLCNSVSWSHVENNLLAVAMEKHRSDHCILIWDVNKGSIPSEESRSADSGVVAPGAAKPLAEMGLSETAHSVSWSNCSNRTLLASMNLKFIKIFDLREWSNKGVLVATSRYCHGVVAEPLGGWQLASRGEAAVCVWDARAFARPLLTLPQPRPVARIQWCPTRRNLLLSLQRDSNTLRLHDIQQAHNDPSKVINIIDNMDEQAATAIEAELEEYERGPSAIERDVCPHAGHAGHAGPAGPAGQAAGPTLASFCWHPTHEARLLAVTLQGGISDYTVCERVTVAWGGGPLAWSWGGALRLLPSPPAAPAAPPVAPLAPLAPHLADISHTMRRRAQTDYGLKPDLWQNADLADDEALSGLWHFLALSKSLVEDGCIRSSPWRHPGVVGVLRAAAEGGAGAGAGGGAGAQGGYRSEPTPSLLPDLPHRRVTLYRSAERSRALSLCGWGWGWESAGAGVERAEAEGTPCRAAALAAFHLRLRHALDVLARAREPQLRVVALALAGLSDERLWRDQLTAAAPALPDAYLRALLRFLAASAPASAPANTASGSPELAAVLAETEMKLEDRVAFACLYLSDSDLLDYVTRMRDDLVERGDLSGILLTGISPFGVKLLQRWVERTGDVQTAALVAARCLPAELARAGPVPDWLQVYCRLICFCLGISPFGVKLLQRWVERTGDVQTAALVAARCLPAELARAGPVPDWLQAYRSLLDSWRLWAARSALDTWWAAGAGAGTGAGGEGVERAVAVACAYCGKPVAAPPAARRPRARLPPPAAKMKQLSSCPNCRKPLPRCGVCSLHLGAGGGAGFGGWFSWCVACRHGGHAHHLLEWFREHTECPVSSCSCHCSTLDPPDRP